MARMDLATRRANCLHVGYQDLVEGFRRVGVHDGDVVFSHSSLSKFGFVGGGAETVVDALAAAVGGSGTVAAPAGTPSLRDGGSFLFDVMNSPSERGMISEAIRLRGAHRSHHLLDSVSAFGPEAESLTAGHSVTNCGAESPYSKLIQRDAQILLLGVSHNSNTTFEAVEERIAPDYVDFTEYPETMIIDERGRRRRLPTKGHNFKYPYDFNRMNYRLIREGAQTEIVIGEAIVRRISAARLDAIVSDAIRSDPYALRLRNGESPMPEIPTSIHDLHR